MHMPNCLVPVSIDLRIISLYRGSKTCSGQGMVGNAMVQTKMGTSWFKLKQEESAIPEIDDTNVLASNGEQLQYR